VLGRHTVSSVIALCALLTSACSEEAPDASETEGIAVGALLPFTGKEAAIGRNLEQALLLAVADVNAAGGINGQPLRLITRDSNSGSERGLEQLLQLLYSDQVSYLIGPEETALAQEVVPDIKALNVLEILPGYAAPSIEHSGSRGAWVRLAPSTEAFACAMGKQVVRSGASSVNALVTADDYSPSLATDFTSRFGSLGGKLLPSVTVPVGASSYARQVAQVVGYGADLTLLMAPPESAATITTEWTIDGRRGGWYLSPLLRADAFLQNIPFGTLNGALGLSPSTSLAGECAPSDGEELTCTHTNATAFAEHFAGYWQGDRPFPAANYYYDAMVLLALALSKGSVEDDTRPGVRGVHANIRELGEPDAVPVRWNDLRGPFAEIRLGTQVRYVGAAAEYEFDIYGAAKHTVFDTWAIANDGFVDTGTVKAVCPTRF
jgi:ABC-type branched-subunit amino acid transport system substrate-binding protein